MPNNILIYLNNFLVIGKFHFNILDKFNNFILNDGKIIKISNLNFHADHT